ncbi:hypothetical protein EVAR_62555_1 [Eumeta japonica]|uniref:Uncharacterized protein n=1 Tax=Eumeta variegata TaxID=151549 RepID=A0A4C1YVX0_EUMVA|nr:hypothetical protein EVAR_62555_1 [Eumeta japonica]
MLDGCVAAHVSLVPTYASQPREDWRQPMTSRLRGQSTDLRLDVSLRYELQSFNLIQFIDEFSVVNLEFYFVYTATPFTTWPPMLVDK